MADTIVRPDEFFANQFRYGHSPGETVWQDFNASKRNKGEKIPAADVEGAEELAGNVYDTDLRAEEFEVATDVIRRINKTTGRDKLYRKTNLWHDKTAMTDAKVDGVIYVKLGDNYYVDTDFVINTTARLSEYVPTDGDFHTIQSVFGVGEKVLSDLETLNAYDANIDASINSSAAWFALQRLLYWLPKNSTVIVDCDMTIDQPIVIKRGFLEILGVKLHANRVKPGYYESRLPQITQINPVADCFAFRDGDGRMHYWGYCEKVTIANLQLDGLWSEGDGISFKYSLDTGAGLGTFGTLITAYFNNIKEFRFANGVKRYNGHINNLFFTDCNFNSNFYFGVYLPSDGSVGQTNYVVMTGVGTADNGYVNIGGEFEAATNSLVSPDYTRGGVRINGTAIYLRECYQEANNGVGVIVEGYLFGGGFTGYAEQNKSGDFVYMVEDQYSKNVLVNSYSRDSTFIFSDKAARRKAIPQEGIAFLHENVLLEYSKNLVPNAALFTPHTDSFGFTRTVVGGNAEVQLSGAGLSYVYFQLEFELYKPGEVYNISMDVKVASGEFDYQDFGFLFGTFVSLYFQVLPIEDSPDWQRISYTFSVPDTASPGYMFPFVRRGVGDGTLTIRLPMVRRLEVPNSRSFNHDALKQVLPQFDSTATDVESLRADFNALLLKLRNAKILQT